MMEWARHLKRQQGMFRWIDEMNGPANKMSFLKDMFEKVVLIQKSRLTYILLAFNLLIYHHWAGASDVVLEAGIFLQTQH